MARVSAPVLAEPPRRLLPMGLGSPDRRKVGRGCYAGYAVDRGGSRGDVAAVLDKAEILD